jgi:hypothetical protein
MFTLIWGIRWSAIGPPCAKTIERPFLPLEKMGSHNGKPVLRDQDVEALVKSSGLGPDQVGPQDQIASAEGQDVEALVKSSGLGPDQVGPQDQIASAEGPGCGGSDQV